MNDTVRAWHKMVESRDVSGLDWLLADDVVFYSPVVHTPQSGKPITLRYLTAAYGVFLNDTFQYVREIVGDHDAVLEFVVEIDGVTKTVKAGEAFIVPNGKPHNATNAGAGKASILATYIVEKGKPLATPVK